MAWMYAIPQYDNLFFFSFLFVMPHKNITVEVHPTFIMNPQKRFLLTLMIYFDVYSSPIYIFCYC